jgi:hypothetical protein
MNTLVWTRGASPDAKPVDLGAYLDVETSETGATTFVFERARVSLNPKDADAGELGTLIHLAIEAGGVP